MKKTHKTTGRLRLCRTTLANISGGYSTHPVLDTDLHCEPTYDQDCKPTSMPSPAR